jgi:hypothetical protein
MRLIPWTLLSGSEQLTTRLYLIITNILLSSVPLQSCSDLLKCPNVRSTFLGKLSYLSQGLLNQNYF